MNSVIYYYRSKKKVCTGKCYLKLPFGVLCIGDADDLVLGKLRKALRGINNSYFGPLS